MIHKIKDPRYAPKTQSELIDFYNKKEELQEELQRTKEEYDKIYTQMLSELCERYNKLSNNLDSVKEISEIYQGKPIKRHSGEYGCWIKEILANHERYAIEYIEDDCCGHRIGELCDGIGQIFSTYNLTQFEQQALDWVVNGTLPDSSVC